MNWLAFRRRRSGAPSGLSAARMVCLDNSLSALKHRSWHQRKLQAGPTRDPSVLRTGSS
eukprot:CAMPEP_0115712174 /NCGR_PEP_ID=MMETSP0272-20121206/73980_1 /TAXON_ID=71861 /ORGANISM="Scrippsiella trochoidea, Strain CCMP3099" /LENGTH=58 /DNA_ID=CAMNT_0003154065 /DNA_START=96 /DNA_END=268 /DNA_ORIENTATION=+